MDIAPFADQMAKFTDSLPFYKIKSSILIFAIALKEQPLKKKINRKYIKSSVSYDISKQQRNSGFL